MKKEVIYKGAGAGKRIGAFLVDYFLISALAAIIYGTILGVTGGDDFVKLMVQPKCLAGLYILIAGLLLLYGALCEGGKKHATWGKRLTGICVVKQDGSKQGSIDVWFRNAIKVLPLLLAAFTLQEGGGVWFIMSWWVLLLIGLCLEEHRSIHDRMSGTMVVCATDVKTVVSTEKKSTAAAVDAPAEENRTVPGRKHWNKWYLIGVTGQYAGMELELTEDLILGRDSNSCNFIFDSRLAGISRVHCRISVSGGSAWLEDLGSSFGTFDNVGKKLIAHNRIKLESGHTFLLGENEQFQMIGK